MTSSQNAIKDELISALRTNIDFLEKDSLKNSNTNVYHNAYNLIDLIESKLKNKSGNLLGVSSDLENFIKLISETNLFKWINFEKVAENQYQVKIESCDLAQQCTHPRLNPEKKICPMALLAASFLKYNHPTAKVFIEPSKFAPHDSETNINLV